MVMFRYCTILGLFAAIAGLAHGSSAGNSEVVYRCAPSPSLTCFLSSVTFEDATASLTLKDVADKKTLNIKGGKVRALRAKHCEGLSMFEKVMIGRVGLEELCFATSFVQVSAEHNRLKTLHVAPPSALGATYRVEELRLNDNLLESVDAVCSFVALKELHLERNLLSTLNMGCFAEMRQLKKLHLAYNRLNIITATISELQLPQLSFIGLQNNTLTELDLHSWSLPALEVLELSSNNLTSVRGLAGLEMLSDISLAGNRWHCVELDQMLAALDRNGVSVKDGDQNCVGIRNGTICCAHEQLSSEGALLDELKKLGDLKQRYDEAEVRLQEAVKSEIKAFESKINELKETHAKRDGGAPGTGRTESDEEKPTDSKEETRDSKEAEAHPKPAPSAARECICSKDSMDALELRLTELEQNISANNATLQALRDNQAQLSYMALLAKHEFRTAVKRGEYKLKELSTMLSMLREHVKQKRQQH